MQPAGLRAIPGSDHYYSLYPPHVLFTQTDPHRSRLFWQAARAVLFAALFLHEAKD